MDSRGLLPLAWSSIDHVGRKIDAFTEAIESGREREPAISEAWLDGLFLDSRNVIQFSQPAPILAKTADEALGLLFEQFIFEPETRRYNFTKKHTALAAVRHEYSLRGLLKGINFDEAAVVRGAHHRERFDFTVLNGQVVQLVQAWSFQVPGQEELLEKIKAWAWTVGDIRKNGGEAQVAERLVNVPSDVDVAAVFVPPAPGTQSKALDEALSAFREVNARAAPFDAAGEVAIRASTLLSRR